jgi:hypothetical protein
MPQRGKPVKEILIALGTFHLTLCLATYPYSGVGGSTTIKLPCAYTENRSITLLSLIQFHVKAYASLASWGPKTFALLQYNAAITVVMNKKNH